ncbi:MAG: hypothetical protein AB1941_24840 [Gemmatimonadota bacterium]
MTIHFVLVGEGTSDDGLIPHLETLCIHLGADEVTGTAIDFRRLDQPVGHSLQAKLGAAVQLEPAANLFFLHRDADSPDPAPRRAEIVDAVGAVGLPQAWVAIVPVQETEAWLLLDEAAIRMVAGKPRGRVPLNLPRANQVESVANPKERLQDALVTASEATGRRLAKTRRDFPEHRRILLQRLPIGGPLREVHSWVLLEFDLTAVIAKL